MVGQPDLGFRRPAFWWATFGDFLLRAGYGLIKRDLVMLSAALGIVDAVASIARCKMARA
jgi:hypothetical protein